MAFESIEEKAEALKFSRLLDVHKWSDYPEVNSSVDALFIELQNDPEFSGNPNLKKKHIKVVVLDLYAAWLSHPELYISYHRDANKYKPNTRYNALRITFLTVEIVNALEKSGYIEHYLGYQDRNTGKSAISKMRATDKLIKLIKDDHKIPKVAIGKHPNTECIILRDKEKRDIAYADTNETNRMRKELKTYNKLLNMTQIEIADPEDYFVLGIDQTNQYLINEPGYFVRRVFNNGSWQQGGRFHGGWWQYIPGKMRRCIRINDSKEMCSEVDYSGLHIIMLYAMENINYWEVDGEDPYKLDEYENTERMRKLLKTVLLIVINAKTKAKAIDAIRQEINFNETSHGWVKGEGLEIEALINAFSGRHKPIQKHLFSGKGIKLQHLDSKIAEKVINHFTNKDIPILCVHDSFLISPLHENELVELMVTSFEDIVKTITPLKVEIEATMKQSCHYSDLLSNS